MAPIRVRITRILLIAYAALWLAYRLGAGDPLGIGAAIDSLITAPFNR
jgi:hypothetical protein